MTTRRRWIVVAGGVVLAALAGAALSASWGLPDRDLARGADRRDSSARHAAATPAAKAVSAPPVPQDLRTPGSPAARVPSLPMPTAARHASPTLPGVPVVPLLPDGIKPVTSSVKVGGMVRTYDLFAPPTGTRGRVPALVVLHGRRSSVTLEERRDGLVELAKQGKALLVYPAGYGESWNAGACCGSAHAAGVDDLSFLTGLIRTIAGRPDVSTVYLVGYSNGGRMAYDIVCSHPKLVSSFVVVAAVPVVACPGGSPVSLLEMVGRLDPLLTYDSSSPAQHINGYLEPTVTEMAARWRRRNGCSDALTTQATGTFRLETWSQCNARSVVALGTYDGGGHAWPVGGGGLPSGAAVLWRFLIEPRATTPVPQTQTPPSTARVPT